MIVVFFVTEVLTDITQINAFSEHPIREITLHALTGLENDNTVFIKTMVYRLELCNI